MLAHVRNLSSHQIIPPSEIDHIVLFAGSTLLGQIFTLTFNLLIVRCNGLSMLIFGMLHIVNPLDCDSTFCGHDLWAIVLETRPNLELHLFMKCVATIRGIYEKN
jgi:hypothetical protein